MPLQSESVAIRLRRGFRAKPPSSGPKATAGGRANQAAYESQDQQAKRISAASMQQLRIQFDEVRSRLLPWPTAFLHPLLIC